MLRVSILLAVISTLGSAIADQNSSEQVCFDSLGCFSLVPPHRSPQRPLPRPSHPAIYDANLVFFARDSNTDPYGTRVGLYPSIDPIPSKFRGDRPKTVIILPGTGATQLGSSTWPIHLKEVILKHIDANIFIGNNTGGPYTLDKFLSAANAPVVARHYSKILDHLKLNKGLKSSSIWIIGFGVGAHIGGFVGKDTHVGRITGLDPAQELFQGPFPQIRLDKSDADFVEVVHSDSTPIIPDFGLGIMDPIGHVDYYLNGGHKQPGCKEPRPFDLIGYSTIIDSIKQPVKLMAESVLCSHKLAHRVFVASLENTECTFWAQPGTYENMLRAISNAGTDGSLDYYTAPSGKCDMKRCVPLGFNSPKSSARGIFILSTHGEPPYCMGDIQPGIKNSDHFKVIKSFVGLIDGYKDIIKNFIK